MVLIVNNGLNIDVKFPLCAGASFVERYLYGRLEQVLVITID